VARPLIYSVFAAALASSVVALSGCGSAAQSEVIAAEKVVRGTPVEVATVVRGELAASYDATASLEAVREATLLAEMAGEVVSIAVEEGDQVVAGQILARVENSRQTLELRQVESVANRISHDERRNETLIARRMISRDAYDKTRYEGQTQAAVVDLKRLDLDKTAIRAPYAGVITRRYIKDGQWLKLQEKAFAIADFSQLQARIDVPERSSALIHPGAAVRFAADAVPGRVFDAVIERMAPVVDTASGTLAAVVAIDNRDRALRPGLFVRLGVTYERIPDALLAPRIALIDSEGNRHVFVVVDGKATRRSVVLGLAANDRVQILDGLAEGEQVVVVGQNALLDGAVVQALTPVAPDPKSGTAKL